MTFDWTISLGNLIQVVVLVGALARIASSSLKQITKRMQAMERRVDMMWGWIIIQMNREQREQFDAWVRNHPNRTMEEDTA